MRGGSFLSNFLSILIDMSCRILLEPHSAAYNLTIMLAFGIMSSICSMLQTFYGR